MTAGRATGGLVSGPIMRSALTGAVRKLGPRALVRNPVILAVEVVAVLATGQLVADLAGGGGDDAFTVQIVVWLWLTVLFANFAEALAEGRGRAQADALRATRSTTMARRVVDGIESPVPAPDLRAGDVIPSDGEVVEGIASVDESAITGESAPVIRAAGGDRSGVTGGTRVLSDRIVVRITADPGHTFLDRMIGLVEGAVRQRTPNEIALSILLAGLSLILVAVCATTIGALLSAIGIAGMNRLVRRNVLATSGRAVEAAGDVSVLLFDKTGTTRSATGRPAGSCPSVR